MAVIVLFFRHRLTRAALAWDGNIVSVDVQSKVSERCAVPHCLLGRVLGQLQALDKNVSDCTSSSYECHKAPYLFIGIRIMSNDTLTNLVGVIDTVHQVGGEVCSGLLGSDGVSIATQSSQRPAAGVGHLTDDRLIRSILTSPVARPTWRVLVGSSDHCAV